MSSRNFFGIPFFSARSRIWKVVPSGKRAAYIRARNAYSVFLDKRMSPPCQTIPTYPIRKIGYVESNPCLRMDQAFRLPVCLGELGVGNVTVPVAGDACHAPEQE